MTFFHLEDCAFVELNLPSLRCPVYFTHTNQLFRFSIHNQKLPTTAVNFSRLNPLFNLCRSRKTSSCVWLLHVSIYYPYYLLHLLHNPLPDINIIIHLCSTYSFWLGNPANLSMSPSWRRPQSNTSVKIDRSFCPGSGMDMWPCIKPWGMKRPTRLYAESY